MNLQGAMEVATAELEEKGVPCRDINSGYCDQWADAVQRLIHGVEVWESDSDPPRIGSPGLVHFFIHYRGRFYDAEAPEGVEHWRELPFFIRNLPPRHRDEFAKSWRAWRSE